MKIRVWLLALCSLVVGLFSLAFASEQPLTAPTPAPIHVVGRMQVSFDPAERAQFETLTQTLFKQTLQLDKPTLYTCNEDVNASGTFVWDEVWSSKDALDKHLASDHFKTWWTWVKPHLSAPLQVLYVDQAEMKTL